jgi:hypothetical protein
MGSFLERLDIRPKVQSFFKPYLSKSKTGETLVFKHDGYFEQAGQSFHRIPITEAIWIAGDPEAATDLFICASAMDAIAWLNLSHHRKFNHLSFIALGAVPYKSHAETIRNYTPKKKLHFLFSNNDLGAICDLKLASYIRNKPLKISYKENLFKVFFENEYYELQNLSLNALEKASGYNFHIRTHKPKKASTYYEQLRNRYLH